MREPIEIVGSNLGSLLTLFAVLMTTPAVVAALWGEWYAIPGVLVAVVLTGASGLTLSRAFEPGDPDEVHGIVTAAVGWLLAGLYGSLPVLFVAWTIAASPGWMSTPPLTSTVEAFQTPLNALFEGMSGVTGTGMTMAETEDDLPRTIQWWRSLMQWVGGIGVVVLAAAIALTAESEAFTSLYEERGAVSSLRDDTRETIKLVWWIFCLLTFVAVVAFWLAGMPLWHAINHAMTGISTGGFAVTEDGIAAYDSVAIEAILVPFMLLGAISFAVHYHLLQGDVETLLGDAQARVLFVLATGGTAVVVMLLAAIGPPLEALRYGPFQYVSALTSTGFQTETELGGRWPVAGLLVLSVAMVIGGAAGSTSGGVKIIRAISLSKGAIYSVTDFFYDTDERSFEIGREESDVTAGRTSSEFDHAATVGFLWIGTLVAVLFVSLVALPTGDGGYAFAEVLLEVTSVQGNVGLSTEITGPEMPASVKFAFVIGMWVGRLEIVPVLVTLRVLLRGFE